MAWIESHQSLRLHPKTLAACATLGIDRHRLIGHLHCLWWWAIDVADIEGWLPTGTPAAVLAGAAEWPTKRADAFADALVGAGFVESHGGHYKLHDWYEYAGRLYRLRQQRAEAGRKGGLRSGEARAKQNAGLVEATGSTNQPNQPNQPTNQPAAAAGLAYRLYYDLCGGTIPSTVEVELREVEDEFPEEWLTEAFAEAARANVRKWKYVKAILNRWREEGFNAGESGRENTDDQPAEGAELARLVEWAKGYPEGTVRQVSQG